MNAQRSIGGGYEIVERDGFVIIEGNTATGKGTLAVLDFDLCQWWATDGTQFAIAERNQRTPSIVNIHRIDTASQMYVEDQVGDSRPQIDAYLLTHVSGASPRSMPITGLRPEFVYVGLGTCAIVPIAVIIGVVVYMGRRKPSRH